MKDKKFTNHYTDADGNRWYQTRTGAEWGEKRILPTNDRMNLVPWVIIYEPMAMVRLEDDTPLAFLTATEYALTQGVNYNWLWAGSESYRQGNWGGVTYPTGGLPGRAIQSLAFNALPGSVTLQERWFGFSESPVAPGAFWSINEILNCGGWGMGFLSASQSLEIQYVDPDCTYLPGREVVTSFIMKNRSSGDIYPEDDLRLYLNASYDRAAARGGAADRVTVLSAVSEPVAIPGEEDTYVWFRWTVPEDVHGEIRLKADYSFGGAVSSSDTVLINESLFEEWETEQSHTPEPTYESRPAWFSLNEIGEQTQSKSWHTWFYDEEIGEFFRWDWEATLGGSAILTPDSRVKSSEYYSETHTWAMRSGYGIACDAQSAVTVTANGETADAYGRNTADAAVPAERGKILFPEFLWSGDFNCYEPAEYIAAETGEGTRTARFFLPENPDARGNRVHFTPLWFPDGFAVYRMAIEWEACWTPAGTLRARTVSDGITIDGSLYDDWYYSRS